MAVGMPGCGATRRIGGGRGGGDESRGGCPLLFGTASGKEQGGERSYANGRHVLAVPVLSRGRKAPVCPRLPETPVLFLAQRAVRAARQPSTFCMTVIPFKNDLCKKKKRTTMG